MRGPRLGVVPMSKKSKAARSGQEDLRSCGFRSARSFDDQLADYALAWFCFYQKALLMIL